MKKRPFSVSGKKTGKLPENLFSFSRYEFDGVYIDPYLRKLKQENENNKKTIHKKAFKVVNPRKTDVFPHENENSDKKSKIYSEETVYRKTFGLFGLKNYTNFKGKNEEITAGSYICSHNDTYIIDPYERKENFERNEKNKERQEIYKRGKDFVVNKQTIPYFQSNKALYGSCEKQKRKGIFDKNYVSKLNTIPACEKLLKETVFFK